MASSAKQKVTCDRGKALNFVIKHCEFISLESDKKRARNLVLHREKDFYLASRDNEHYAQSLCHFAVNRHISLLNERINAMKEGDAKRAQLISTRD